MEFNYKILVQIGTKDGSDNFLNVVKESDPALVVLIEPNKENNNSILKNYEGIANVHLENVAITDKDYEVVTLVHPKKVRDIIYDSGKFSLLPMDDWGDDLVKIEAPGMAFMTLCSKYSLDHIDYLQIDTEGYDAEIIKSIDFLKVKINTIKYEQWNFSVDCFTRHGEKGKGYGRAGMAYIEKLLESKGYELRYMDYDIMAFYVGT